MSEPRVELRDLSKQYRVFRRARYRVLDALGLPVPRSTYEEVWALRDVSLEVPAGQRLGIIGRNGAGKTTLLRIVGRQVAPTRGRAIVRGQVQALMELGTGFYPDFTGRQNVFAALAFRGIRGVDAERRFEEIADFAELKEFIDHPVTTYSAGMYARLAFAIASSVRPEVLIVDEVLSAGDAYFAGKCFERMRQLTVESGATVLVVSHDLNAVQAICNRVIWLKTGRIVQDGDPLSVLRAYYREVQEEENLRFASGTRRLAGRDVAGGEPAGEPGTAPRAYRFCFQPDSQEFEEAPRIAAIALRDPAHQETAGIIAGAPPHGDCRLLGESAWEGPKSVLSLLSQAVRRVGGAELPGFEATVSVSLERLLAGYALVLRVLPSPRYRMRVGFQRDGEVVPIGEVLPDPTPRWQDQAFALDIVTNLDTSVSTGGDGRSSKSIVTWAVPDPRIESVRFLNADLKPVIGIQEGEHLIVEISYDASKPVDNPVFGMSIYLPDGRAVCRALSSAEGRAIGRIHGRGRVRFVFAPFLGGAGEYVVSASIYERIDLSRPERPPLYDCHDRAYRFRVWKDLGLALDPVLMRAPYAVQHLTAAEAHDERERGRGHDR